MPLSPQSEAKQRGKHYFVKDRVYGHICLNCSCANEDLEVLKAIKCEPPPGSETRVAAADAAELELGKLRDLEAEGLQLQELLAYEQRQLEEMMIQAEIEELERQVAIEEQQLHEATVRSLEDAAAAAAARQTKELEPPAAKDAKQVEAPAARETKQVEAPAASETKQVEAPAAGETNQVEAPAAGETNQVEAPAAAAACADAEQVEPPAMNAKPPCTSITCFEASSTPGPNPVSSGDPESLAKNALLGAPSFTSATGSLAYNISLHCALIAVTLNKAKPPISQQSQDLTAWRHCPGTSRMLASRMP